MILRRDGVSVVATPDGTLDAKHHPSSGLYFRDTRHCSRLVFTLGGVPPILLDHSEHGAIHSAVFTNERMSTPGGVIPANVFVIRRWRLISKGLHESLTISNYGSTRHELDLRIDFGADFHDIFEVRGFERRGVRPAVSAAVEGACVRFSYDGADGRRRTSELEFSPAPQHLTESRAHFRMPLDEGESATITYRLSVGERARKSSFPALVRRVQREQAAWLEGLTHVQTDNELFNAAITRSLLDIDALQTKADGNSFVGAGVPWFDTLFGRDSLITGIFFAGFSPRVLRQSLLTLARYQATAVDPERDATPGKIPHELRWGELARAGDVPFSRYYGSIDSTPLFLIGAGEYFRWTHDLETLSALWPALLNAREWLRNEVDCHGFYSYERGAMSGLANQGWKDSHDAIQRPDGTQVHPPIALVEVQGYAAAALRAFADLAAALGRPDLVAEAQQDAEHLRRRIESTFGSPGIGYALCLDGDGTAIPTPASNAGHLLWSGVATPDRAGQLIRMLMGPEMFSGWGIRTLSSGVRRFNPLGYHTGSVWPHDSAMILSGLRRYGHDAEAERLATAMLEAVLVFPNFLVPELFAGDDRALRPVPTPYPVASRPQAWAASTVGYVLLTMLGLRPVSAEKLAVVRPCLPLKLHWVSVRNLACGQGTVDITFRRHGSRTSVDVEDIRGHIDVVLSAEWPDAWPLTWGPSPARSDGVPNE